MKKNYYDDMLSRFHLIPECYGRTDRQTDRFAISISRVSMLTRDEKKITRFGAQSHACAETKRLGGS